MAVSETVLMTVECKAAKPRFEDVAAALKVPVDAIDRAYGIVPVDPARKLFAVQVEASAVSGKETGTKEYRGPFSNPRIDTFRT